MSEKTCHVEAEDLIGTSNELGIHLHNLFAAEKGNVFFSPFYLSSTLTIVLREAKARGQDYLSEDASEVVSAFQKQMSTLLDNPESYVFKSAFSVLNVTGFEMMEELKLVLDESFKALILDEGISDDTSEFVGKINEWVDEKTDGLIPVQVDFLDANRLGLLFMSSLYFKGIWLHIFDDELTNQENFYNNGKEDEAKVVDMMHLRESILFAEKETFQVLQLPYLREEIVLLILLPNEMDGLEALEATLTPDFINDLSPDLCEKKMNLSLPRFRIEYSQWMDYSKHRGVGSLFSSENADNYPEFVCEIMLKAVLEVNEGGSSEEAFAKDGSSDEQDCDVEVSVNHPFAFMIYDVSTNLIIFMGRVEEL